MCGKVSPLRAGINPRRKKKENKMEMLKAITVRFVGPTNTRGARFVATDNNGNTQTMHQDYSLPVEESHRRAAQALADKMQWRGKLVGGWQGHKSVWVFLP